MNGMVLSHQQHGVIFFFKEQIGLLLIRQKSSRALILECRVLEWILQLKLISDVYHA